MEAFLAELDRKPTHKLLMLCQWWRSLPCPARIILLHLYDEPHFEPGRCRVSYSRLFEVSGLQRDNIRSRYLPALTKTPLVKESAVGVGHTAAEYKVLTREQLIKHVAAWQNRIEKDEEMKGPRAGSLVKKPWRHSKRMRVGQLTHSEGVNCSTLRGSIAPPGGGQLTRALPTYPPSHLLPTPVAVPKAGTAPAGGSSSSVPPEGVWHQVPLPAGTVARLAGLYGFERLAAACHEAIKKRKGAGWVNNALEQGFGEDLVKKPKLSPEQIAANRKRAEEIKAAAEARYLADLDAKRAKVKKAG